MLTFIIAAALSRKADLFLLDEPSAYLDVEERLNMAKALRRVVEAHGIPAFVVEHDVVTQDFIADRLMVFSGEPGVKGKANPPTTLRRGMNLFLKDMNVTFRRDSVTRRPRVNKEGSRLDIMQKDLGEYYYTRVRPQTETPTTGQAQLSLIVSQRRRLNYDYYGKTGMLRVSFLELYQCTLQRQRWTLLGRTKRFLP